jgi:hypothetical protein
METLFITLGVFLFVVLIMSVGIIFKRKPLQGTCGGISTLMGGASCDICDKKTECFEKLTKKTDCHDKDSCHTHPHS